MEESVEKYYEHLTDAYLDIRNDENSKCKNFRTILEEFFNEYMFPDLDEEHTLYDLQKMWYMNASGDFNLNKLISETRKELNQITHGKRNINGDKKKLFIYFKSCVTIVYHLSMEEPGERTRVALGESDKSYFKNLNEQQGDAIQCPERIVYVNAGPGSGKTRLLMYKIVDILNREKDNAKIVALSYTRSSANSLSEKLRTVVTGISTIPFSGTIHSFCLNCLKAFKSQHGEAFDYIIADESEIDEVIDDILQELDGEFSYDEVIAAINNPTQASPERIRQVIEEKKKLYKRISVSDILRLFLNEITKNDDFINWCSDRMNYVLVDEAQDLTRENYQIFHVLLTKIPELKIFLVGDPRQNIFEFLGGSFKYLNEFLNAHQDEYITKALSTSYRCPQKILNFTNEMKFADCENIYLSSKSATEGTIYVNEYEDEYKEAEEVVKYIKEKNSYSNTAVISSRLFDLQNIAEQLNSEGIRFIVQGGSNGLKPHIHAILCMNQLVEKKFSLLGTINTLCSKLNKPKVKLIREFITTDYGKEIYKIAQQYYGRGIGFATLQNEFLKICCKHMPENKREEISNDFKLLSDLVITKSDSPETFIKRFRIHQKKFLSLSVDLKSTGSSKEAVTLSTIHSSKGLEWDYVILPKMCDHIFPGGESNDNFEINKNKEISDTTKKLFFVAVTRTKNELFISYPKKIRDSHKDTTPSRFISSLLNQ